jgi:hypothetical protein
VYERIPSVFEALERQATRDPTRAVIEFYRSRDVIDLLLPVARSRPVQAQTRCGE